VITTKYGVYVPGITKPIGIFVEAILAEMCLIDQGMDTVGGVEVRLIRHAIVVGDRVASLKDFAGVPAGTRGVVIEDYGTGVNVAWDLPDRPYPGDLSPREVATLFAIDARCPLRDGFDKETELMFLMVVG